MRLVTLFFIMSSFLTAVNLRAEDQHNADRNQLKQLLADVEKAINQADIKQLSTHLHDNVIVTFLDAEVARGIPAVQHYFNKTISGSNAILANYQTRASISAPAILFGNTAIAQGSAQDKFTLNTGHIIAVDTLWSATLLKQDETWKIIQLHFSSNLFDNALLASAQKNMMLFAAIAAIIGIFTGIIILFLFRKISTKKS